MVLLLKSTHPIVIKIYVLPTCKNSIGLGNLVFSPIIDESYDEIDNLEERTKQAFNSFMLLQKENSNSIRQKLQSVLDHNEKCMRDKAWLTQRARNLLQNLQTPV